MAVSCDLVFEEFYPGAETVAPDRENGIESLLPIVVARTFSHVSFRFTRVDATVQPVSNVPADTHGP